MGIHMRRIIAAGLAIALPLAAAAAETTTAYDLLFRNGTLDALDRDRALVYDRTVSNALNGTAADRDTGRVVLDIDQPADGPETVDMTFRKDGKFRGLGSFRASVGNPMIMYFYETTVRDMAESAGGSPFYIRNRIKDALTVPQEVRTATADFDGTTIDVQRVTLKPFADDPNRDAMQGFGDLEMTVTMSDAIPGWYLSLEAEVPGASGPVYSSTLRFAGLEDAE
ncbi:hypothetical protein PARU111607_00025 [Palleronia rufa]